MTDVERFLDTIQPLPVDEKWKIGLAARLRNQVKARRYVRRFLCGSLAAVSALALRAALTPDVSSNEIPPTLRRVPLSGHIELDDKEKDEILNLRQEAIERSRAQIKSWPKLIWRDQSQSVWRAVGGLLPWVGTQCPSSPELFASRFHNGASVDSFFLLNPLALIGLQRCELRQGRVQVAGQQPDCKEIKVIENTRQVRITYEVAKGTAGDSNGQCYVLNTSNAADAGFDHFEVSPGSSFGFDYVQAGPNTCGQEYSTGRSLTGPVANLLDKPDGPMSVIQLSSVPAKVTVRLWRKGGSVERLLVDDVSVVLLMLPDK